MMRLVFISDTHNKHRELELPDGDILIHTGDWSNLGRFEEASSFISWFGELPYRHKIFINGNHELEVSRNRGYLQAIIPDNIVYLENSIVEIAGITFYGSPHTPHYGTWAYMKDEKELKLLWGNIPHYVDILLTHCPPFGILDQNRYGEHCGSKSLKEEVERVKPKIHAFGHIHESAGEINIGGVEYINSCMTPIVKEI